MTEPGLIQRSKTGSGSPTVTPSSSAVSRRIAVAGSSVPSRPAAASTSHPVGVVVDVAMQDPRYSQRTITVSFMAVDVRNHRLLNWQIGLP